MNIHTPGATKRRTKIDSMSMKRFDNILNNNIKQTGCNEQCCAPMITPPVKTVIQHSPEEPIQLSTSSVQEMPRPSQLVDKSNQRVAIGPQIESIRMAQTMMANMVKQNLEVCSRVPRGGLGIAINKFHLLFLQHTSAKVARQGRRQYLSSCKKLKKKAQQP